MLDQQSESKFEETTRQMARLFTENDPESTGFVPYNVMKAIIYDKSVNLPERLAQMALIEVEINEEGYCNYDNFLKISTSTLDMAEVTQPNIHPENQPRLHIHGLLQEEFEQTLTQKFADNQASGSGVLDRAAIQKSLHDEELGLSRREVNLVMGYIETNFPDGSFDYSELSQTVYELLFDAHEQNILSLPFDPQQVKDILIADCQDIDKDNRFILYNYIIF